MELKQLIDRKDTTYIKNLDRMVLELGKYMTPTEIDLSVDLINTLSDSKFDINLTEDDASSQLKILLGSERYHQLKMLWNKDNQHLLKDVGVKKYLHVQTNTLWDGLDDTDNPEDYIEVYA
jgi:hypothetical protein